MRSAARIERAWVKPRTLPGDEPFECGARILQRPDGRIEEVMLLDCTGSGEWQRSLVAAIEQASPLPIAPHPSVFVHALTLKFEQHADTLGRDAAQRMREVRTTRMSP